MADAGLANAADAGQSGLGGARLAHHLAEQFATSRHVTTIALDAIRADLQPRLPLCKPVPLPDERLARHVAELEAEEEDGR